jgi:hypothetical protein
LDDPAISEMRAEMLSSNDLGNISDGDGPSNFGVLFRATLLNSQPANKQWNTLRTLFLNTLKNAQQPAP